MISRAVGLEDSHFRNLLKTLKRRQRVKVWFLSYIALHENFWRERNKSEFIVPAMIFLVCSFATVWYFGIGSALVMAAMWLIFLPALIQLIDSKNGRRLEKPTYLYKYMDKLLNIKSI